MVVIFETMALLFPFVHGITYLVSFQLGRSVLSEKSVTLKLEQCFQLKHLNKPSKLRLVKAKKPNIIIYESSTNCVGKRNVF